MCKKNLQALAWTSAVCTVVVTFTDYATTKKWKDIHTNAMFVSGLLSLVGFAATA